MNRPEITIHNVERIKTKTESYTRDNGQKFFCTDVTIYTVESIQCVLKLFHEDHLILEAKNEH